MPATQIRSLGSEWDEAFKDLDMKALAESEASSFADAEPMLIRCLVAKDHPPRLPQYEMLMYMGMGFIDDILMNRPFDTRPSGGDLTFYFPENYMTPWEEQRFITCLRYHVMAPFVHRADIVTTSPMIVQNLCKEQLRILQRPGHREAQLAAWRGHKYLGES